MIEERIAGGPEQYQSEKEKYFQGAWSGQPFKNKVRVGAALCFPPPPPFFGVFFVVCLLCSFSSVAFVLVVIFDFVLVLRFRSPA